MFSVNRLFWRDFDWILIISVIFLCAIGFAAIYSVDLSRGSALIYTKKQFIAFTIGFLAMAVAAFSSHTFFKTYAKSIYVLSFVLLLAVLFLGRNIRGTTGWFSFGGFSFQPVEFAKIGLILMIAYISANFGRRFDKPLFFFGTGVIAAILIGLVMLQPDLGSSVLLGGIWLGLVWLVGVRRVYLVGFLATLVIVSIGAWFYIFADYQKDRVLTFLDPNRDPLGSGYNSIQATIAIGSGGLFGRGLGFGSQSQLKFLPETQTDFIFSVIGEELGMAGVMVILALYMIIFWRLITIVRFADDDFTAMVASGAVILFFLQFFINIGANVGLLPVTGITLPFVSYGGSSLITNLFLIGIVESLNKKRI